MASNVERYKNVCRACLSTSKDMKDLFASQLNDINLDQIFSSCTQLSVNRMELLPKRICSVCVNNLQIAYDFQEMCRSSEKELREAIEVDVKIKKMIDTTDDDTTINSAEPILPQNTDEPIKVESDITHIHANILSIDDKTVSTIANGAIKRPIDSSDTCQAENKTYACKICDKTFNRSVRFERHLKTHVAEPKVYNCSECTKHFATATNQNRRKLKRHKIVHTDHTNLQFNLSNKLIESSDHPNKHSDVKSHVCLVCNKGFRQSCTLKDHMRTHSGETPYLCSQCGKAFNNSSNLRQHMIRHAGTKPYACTECPSRFSCKGGLKSHMATHTGLKPYACDECGSSFTKPYSLVKHKRIHSGDRPYSCEMCSMKFTSSDHVKRHMRTHTGEKPYKCKYCERAFAQSNDLVKHLRSHVGVNTYQCVICPQSFRLYNELREHGKIHFQQGAMEGIKSEIDQSNDVEGVSTLTDGMVKEENQPTVMSPVNIDDIVQLNIPSHADADASQLSDESIIVASAQDGDSSVPRRLVIQPVCKLKIDPVTLRELQKTATAHLRNYDND